MRDLLVAPWRQTASRPVYDSGDVHLLEAQLLGLDGTMFAAVRAVEAPTTRVVAVTRDDEVVLWWRWRHTIGGALLELPGADITAGTDPAGAARAGLRAAGWAARRWELLTDLYCVTGVAGQRVHLYLARDLHRAPAPPAADRCSFTVPYPVADSAAAGGGIGDTASAAALLIAARRPDMPPRTEAAQ